MAYLYLGKYFARISGSGGGFEDPVTITPMPFTKNDEIVIRFDATKAQSNGTAGLIGADKVYIHSGVLIDHPDSTELSHIVGNLADDGLGEMVEVEEDIWEITLTCRLFCHCGR